jgi:branched-chain amino acid transport system permease protein
MARANRAMVRDYADDLKLFRSPGKRVGLVLLLVVYLTLPLLLDDFWAGVLTLAGITAVGALGLNLLTGYTGQASLGTAFFIGLGAFTASYLGRASDLGGKGMPFVVYLFAAAVLGGLVGFVVGLPALRLRGNYLVIVTVGLVFIGLYIFTKWTTVTGGPAGTSMPIKVDVLGNNFASLPAGGTVLGRDQGLFYVVWAIVAIVALLVKNIVRTRPGRALQAVRDRDVAAEVIGVSLFRYKVGAFVLSSAVASVAGVLFGLHIQNLSPDPLVIGLFLSVQYLAIIIVGGIGTVYGSVLGAVLIGGMPAIIDRVSENVPFLTSSATGSGINKNVFAQLLYGVLIIVFLVLEPHGLAGIWQRAKAYFQSWPFSR